MADSCPECRVQTFAQRTCPECGAVIEASTHETVMIVGTFLFGLGMGIFAYWIKVQGEKR